MNISTVTFKSFLAVFTVVFLQFKFGVEAPSREDDESLKTNCLDICPYASARPKSVSPERCPQVA